MKTGKVFVILLALVFAVVVLSGCGSTTTSKVGTAPDGSEVAIEKTTVKFHQNVNDGKYQLLSTEELNNWVTEKKDMIIIDTMPAENFAKGHIPGAVNAELPKTVMADVTDAQKTAFINLLGQDKNKPIVVYCGFVACDRSHLGAVIAVEQGFTNVYRVPGGIIAWQEAGYTVEE
ncbi:putative rhodanese-related sulfurtransferase [Sporotomaculum syntrophicum]|uniref:Rhodanese-related sulfurtransferase n=1 Tax=Sporotomaculum syntrophicum TaxID=182264 RepID=A0A9D2WQI5_9FIRM|nr:rhodanese-like domain-containing protein [Sporotomaculum syntrophicum]KAF1085519.1 putative rhodanese-related sulfurtransferase [Sporotomaculum syntrophicum]